MLTFIVRDRALFAEVISKESSTNYDLIKEKTNTDLILELISVNTDIPYKTNSYIDKNGVQKIFANRKSYTFDGASIEFKLIKVKSNDMLGYYKFNYSPYPEGEEFAYYFDPIFGDTSLKRIRKSSSGGAYQSVEQDYYEPFISDAISKFVSSLN